MIAIDEIEKMPVKAATMTFTLADGGETTPFTMSYDYEPKGGPLAAIFGPFLAMVLLTLVVWVYMYARRIPFLQSLDVEPNDLTPGILAERSPPAVANPSDNLKNLFEVPVLFYALALYLYVTEQVDGAYVTAGWVFFAFRVAHSAVHCTVNIVLLRFWIYFASTLVLWFMAGRALLRYLAAG